MSTRLCCLALLCAAPFAAQAGDPGPTYVIPVRDMIERGLVYVIRRGVSEAEADGAGAIVFDMNTPGGRLDATEEIIRIITGIDAVTYTYVNPNAISAGAIIAFATDHIYMSPNGRIGDAMPVMMSPIPMGGAQEIPEGLKEKAVSPTAALIRSAAQRKGHDPELAEAMVRPEIEYAVGDTVISPAGRLLTLTSTEAAQPVGEAGRPLLSEGTVENLDALLERIGRAGTRRVTVRVTPAESVARIIEGFPMSGILLALGLLGLYIEFKTPGFGVPGIAGILLLAVWFWGHNVAGLAGVSEILLFLVGAILLGVEIFVIPGFGVVGLTGLGCMFAAVLMAMIQHYPGTPWYLPPAQQVQTSIRNTGLSLVLVFAAGALLSRLLPRTRAFHRLALAGAVGRAEGYQASPDTSPLVGRSGRAATPLRPAGIGRFGDERLNVVARGQFIEKDTPIRIVETHGNRIIVEATV
ncbi:MAG: hypothetical protein JW951_06180 [Lentisphaerae bacterium]|nr:hypothetical protein [Lentisphaerota bacterium]